MQLTGFVRNDGRVGFRNYVAVISLAGCAQTIAERIAREVPGCIAIAQPMGCELLGADQERLGTILKQLATHPNVGAALFLTLGCAASNVHQLSNLVAQSGRLSKLINVQQVGGTTASVNAGADEARKMVEALSQQERVSVPLSSIVLGTKCGASDKTSFEMCHPVLGRTCDLLVDLGATIVLSEDVELYPVVEDLAARAVDAETASQIIRMAEELDARMFGRCGMTAKELWGDETKAREAAIGHVAKAGTRPIQRFFKLGEQVGSGGLVVLEAPNSDIVSITSMAAAGCNMLAFTTGKGTPVASPVAPTVKITANPKTYETMNENTDFLVQPGDDSSAEALLEVLLACANGVPTKGELVGHGEMFIPLEGVTF